MVDHKHFFLRRHEEGGGVYICSWESGHRVYLFHMIYSFQNFPVLPRLSECFIKLRLPGPILSQKHLACEFRAKLQLKLSNNNDIQYNNMIMEEIL